jgi:hypothetical protein
MAAADTQITGRHGSGTLNTALTREIRELTRQVHARVVGDPSADRVS